MGAQKAKPFTSTRKRKVALTAVIMTIMLFGLLTVGCQPNEKNQPKPSVAVGTWIASQKIAEKDNVLHPMKYRIDAITRDQAIVTAAISQYNLSGTGNLIGQLQNDNLEFCMAEYSATYPTDFPHSNFGITDVAVPFEIVSLTGGAIQVEDTIYQNLATTWEIGDLPEGYDFHAGDTYAGKIIFIMVKDYSDYLIHEIKGDSPEEEQVYIKGE
jgi:hypothetical protein